MIEARVVVPPRLGPAWVGPVAVVALAVGTGLIVAVAVVAIGINSMLLLGSALIAGGVLLIVFGAWLLRVSNGHPG